MLIQADARHIPLRDECVQCVVTSPPYFGLRDYGTARWDGGDQGCDHKGRQAPRRDTASGPYADFGTSRGGQASKAYEVPYRDQCGKCGARRMDQQIGLEATPDAYVAVLVEVFREVRRVLKDDGTVWLNLGDSYARNGGMTGGGNRELLHMDGKQRRMLTIPTSNGLKER